MNEPGSRFCDNGIRAILKDKMSALAEKYPMLCIISGTVATKKHFEKIHDEKYIANIIEHVQEQIDNRNANRM